MAPTPIQIRFPRMLPSRRKRRQERWMGASTTVGHCGCERSTGLTQRALEHTNELDRAAPRKRVLDALVPFVTMASIETLPW